MAIQNADSLSNIQEQQVESLETGRDVALGIGLVALATTVELPSLTLLGVTAVSFGVAYVFDRVHDFVTTLGSTPPPTAN